MIDAIPTLNAAPGAAPARRHPSATGEFRTGDFQDSLRHADAASGPGLPADRGARRTAGEAEHGGASVEARTRSRRHPGTGATREHPRAGGEAVPTRRPAERGGEAQDTAGDRPADTDVAMPAGTDPAMASAEGRHDDASTRAAARETPQAADAGALSGLIPAMGSMSALRAADAAKPSPGTGSDGHDGTLSPDAGGDGARVAAGPIQADEARAGTRALQGSAPPAPMAMNAPTSASASAYASVADPAPGTGTGTGRAHSAGEAPSVQRLLHAAAGTPGTPNAAQDRETIVDPTPAANMVQLAASAQSLDTGNARGGMPDASPEGGTPAPDVASMMGASSSAGEPVMATAAPGGLPAESSTRMPTASFNESSGEAGMRSTERASHASREPAPPTSAAGPVPSGQAIIAAREPAAADALARQMPAAVIAGTPPERPASPAAEAPESSRATPRLPAGRQAAGVLAALDALRATLEGPSAPGDAAPSVEGFSRAWAAALREPRPAESRTQGGEERLTPQSGPAGGAFAAMMQNSAPVSPSVSTAGAAVASTSVAVSPPVDDPAFPAALSTEVTSLVLQGIGSASIEVSPPDMGPIRIELSLAGESASVAFSAAQPDTRQAIEQALPTLHSMLAGHGLELSNASVTQGGFGQGPFSRPGSGQAGDSGRGHREDSPSRARRDLGGIDSLTGASGAPPMPGRANGLLDLYA